MPAGDSGHLATLWEEPPAPDLKPGEVHVWRARLEVEPRRLPGLRGMLSAQERAEASRRRFPEDRHRAIAAHAIVRSLLGSYLDLEPAEIGIKLGPFGKPSLAQSSGDLRFNLSHSEGLALIGFSRGAEVGIDLERSQAIEMDELVASGFLSEGEWRALKVLDDAECQDALLRCWTRKEAYLKAIGRGLGAALREIQVSIDRGSPALLQAPEGGDETRRWTLIDLAPEAGYAACLAVEGQPALSCWTWRWPPLASD